eukprot:2702746-Pleurochrysis_carterae.AAC.10
MLQKLAGWSPVKQIGPRAGLRSAVQFDAQVDCASVASAGSQKAADSHGSEVQSPAFSRSKSTVRSSLASRRMSFFCSTGLNEQERIERDEARKCALALTRERCMIYELLVGSCLRSVAGALQNSSRQLSSRGRRRRNTRAHYAVLAATF